MGHEIDLSSYQIRTDLAIESINIKDKVIKPKVENIGKVTITDLFVDKEISLQINKKIGHYVTIEFEDITDYVNKEKVKTIFSQKLRDLIKNYSIKKNPLILIIGLGNHKSTPDALGPLSISNIIVTNHLYELAQLEDGFERVCAISPGVMGQTGIETSDIIKGVVKQIKPDLVITIDALASSSLDRVNRTIQMTDAGINPGSGIGNHRKEISKEVLDVPVIAVGVPTVVDAVTIVADTINYMHRHFSYTKKNINNPFNKLVPFSFVKTDKEDIEIDDSIRQSLLGMVGTLNNGEVRSLVYEVLTPIGYNLMVTPKEVDFVMEKLSDVIGSGINQALHKKVD